MTAVAGYAEHRTSRLPWFAIGCTAGVLSALALLLTATSYWLDLIAILALAWWLPGVMLAAFWRLPNTALPALLLYALGLGLAWLILLALGIHYWPGEISRTLLLSVYGIGGSVLCATTFMRRPLQLNVGSGHTWLWAIALLLLATSLRLPGIGYHELHADEAVLLRQSRRAVEGQDDALAQHTKGPGEIAVVLSVYRALGTASETTTRLPFALMSVGSVLALAWLGTRMFNGTTGMWAGILLAVNGFALGLSRIAQYQPAVLLLTALTVLAMWEFSRCGRPRWLALAAAYSAFGLVMHYEFALLAPALIYLAWQGWRLSTDKHTLTRTLLLSAGGAAIVVAAAYLPALLNPYLSTTQGYLSNRMGGIGTFNVAFFVEMSTFYNSVYYAVALLVLFAAGTVLGWRRARRQTLALTLWWLPYFILYIFIIRFPGTHFYLLMQSWCLLAAIPLAALTARSARPSVRWIAYAAIGVWLAVSTYYLYLLFFRQQPEYLVNIEEEQSPAYWAPFPVPEKPRFGFPIQAGWKTVGVLGEWGYLQGISSSDEQDDAPTYNSNDKAWSIRRWYLTSFDKADFEERPDYVFIASQVQEPNPDFDADILDEYNRAGDVLVHGEPRIQIWAREPLPAYVSYDAQSYSEPFMVEVANLEPVQGPTQRVAEAPLGDAVMLQSAHLGETRFQPGESVELLLVWRALQPLPEDYKVFVHVADEAGRPVAQWDGFPGLNTARTSEWQIGQTFRDHIFVEVPDNAPAGEYRLLVGLYDPDTGTRLGETAVEIAEIIIQ